MKVLFLFLIATTVILNACSQNVVMNSVDKIEAEVKRIDRVADFKLRIDTVICNDKNCTVDTFFIGAANKRLIKTVRISDTQIDTVKKYRLDTLSKDRPMKLKVELDSTFYVEGTFRKKTTYYFFNNELIKVTVLQTNGNKSLLTGSYYFNHEKMMFKGMETTEQGVKSNLDRGKPFYEDAEYFFNAYLKS